LGGALSVARADLPAARAGQTVMLRPEDLLLARCADDTPGHATVTARTFLGADGHVVVRCATGTELLARARQAALPALAVGDAVQVSAAPGAAWLIPAGAAAHA
jgi:hypothetical protein